MRTIRRYGLQLRERAAYIVGRVFVVDQQPVEAGSREQFDDVGIGERGPQAKLRFAFCKGALEAVFHAYHYRASNEVQSDAGERTVVDMERVARTRGHRPRERDAEYHVI